MIIADENIDQLIIEAIQRQKFDLYSIKKESPGINDTSVIKLAKSKKGIVLTEDKDFGELIFSHKIKSCSVIFLRYKKSERENIIKNIISVLKKYFKHKKENLFITITTNKTRIRNI